jgi:hypothetical protein
MQIRIRTPPISSKSIDGTTNAGQFFEEFGLVFPQPQYLNITETVKPVYR